MWWTISASAAVSNPPCTTNARLLAFSPAMMTSPKPGAATVDPIAAVEIAVAPLAVNARHTAGVFTLLNLLLLLFFRLPAEQRVIEALTGE